jgi:hypothetical protein
MKAQGWKKYALGAGSMLVLVMAILLVSGWGTAAADQLLNVFVTNTAANPVPVSGTLTVTNPPASPLAVHESNTDANGNIKVHEQGTVQVGGSVSVSNLPGTQPVSGTVNVGNFPADFPAAPKTVIISTGSGPIGLAGGVIVTPVDTSAYRELTLYLTVLTTGLGTVTCTFNTWPTQFPENNFFPVDSITVGTDKFVIKTVEPAPPNLDVSCDLNGFTPVPIAWELVGRTG